MIKTNKWCYKLNHPITDEWLANNHFRHSSSHEGYVHTFPAYKHNNTTVLTGEIVISDEDKSVKVDIYGYDHTPYGPWYDRNFVQYGTDYIDTIEDRVHKELRKLGIVERVRKKTWKK